MLPTFVIGLREGLEAALIVGIVAAFLRKQGRRDLLRWVFVGVGAAVLLCLGVGIGLDAVSKNLPQREQEGLETVIGALAVVMVTYMVIWMRRHSRELKGQLEGLAAEAMDGQSRAGRAMVAMAFLAVLREGFETVVFLLAAFNEAGSGSSAPVGAVLGIAVAVVLGYGIYRGGVHINLSKFFRATGLVLVLVAAGLVVNALHTAHEAGWLNVGQGRTVDLSWLVQPGSVHASLLTGMLGIQPRPVLAEVIGWLVYLVPVGCYVAWPPGRTLARRTVTRTLLAVGAVAAVAAASFAVFSPARPAAHPVTAAGPVSAEVVSRDGSNAVVRTQRQSPAGSGVGAIDDITMRQSGSDNVNGLQADRYTATVPGDGAQGLPATMSLSRIAELNGGRLPIGLRPTTGGTATVSYTDSNVLTVRVEPRTGRVVGLTWVERVTAAVADPSAGRLPLASPVADATSALPASATDVAAAEARHGRDELVHRSVLTGWAWAAGVLAVALLVAGVALALATRRHPSARGGERHPAGQLISS